MPCADAVGQRLDRGVEQVARAAAVQGRDRVRLAQAQGPQVGGVRLARGAVHLVGAQHHGLAGAAQQLHDALVGGGGADGGVDHEHHGVRQGDRDLGLLGHLGLDAGDVDLPAARVHEHEPAAGPLGRVGHAVARHARLVLHDGLAAAEDPVDQGRLADVRPPDDGEHRQRLLDLGVLVGPLGVQERLVRLVELELLEADAQRALARDVVLGLGEVENESGARAGASGAVASRAASSRATASRAAASDAEESWVMPPLSQAWRPEAASRPYDLRRRPPDGARPRLRRTAPPRAPSPA